jgi:hypothetical protein
MVIELFKLWTNSLKEFDRCLSINEGVDVINQCAHEGGKRFAIFVLSGVYSEPEEISPVFFLKTYTVQKSNLAILSAFFSIFFYRAEILWLLGQWTLLGVCPKRENKALFN